MSKVSSAGPALGAPHDALRWLFDDPGAVGEDDELDPVAWLAVHLDTDGNLLISARYSWTSYSAIY